MVFEHPSEDNELKTELELRFGLNYVPLTQIERPNSECLSLLPESIMRQYNLVPISKNANQLTLAMVDPNDLEALDDIKLRLKGLQVTLCVCALRDFKRFLDSCFILN